MSGKRNTKALIHATANCEDCEWNDEDYHKAPKTGPLHAKKTGHTVSVETGYWIIYNAKKN